MKRSAPNTTLSPATVVRWRRMGLWLVGTTLAYNIAEGLLAIWAGVQAHSIALVGFGLDSFIECAAAGVLLWRLAIEAGGASAEVIERSERRVHRFIGGTFFALALYVLLQAGWTLWQQKTVEESLLGIVLAVASLVIMPLVSWGKLRAAQMLNSAALRAEAKETLACAYLSFTLLLGLVANAIAGWWWADPVAALLMVPWLIKEGVEGFAVRTKTKNKLTARRVRDIKSPSWRPETAENLNSLCTEGSRLWRASIDGLR